MAALERAITTQEELDAVIGERLKRERETSAKKYEGWTSPDDLKKITDEHGKAIKKLQDAAAEAEKTLAEKDKQIAEGAKYKTDLEKTRIALAAGLPEKYASRLVGENADEWKADAEAMAKDFAPKQVAPLGNPDPTPKAEKSERDAYRSMLKGLDGGK